MKKFLGLCAVLALITGGVVFSDEVRSIVEQNTNADAVQAVESAVDDSVEAPIQEALPEESVSEAATPSDVVEVVPEPEPTIPQTANAQYILGVIASPVPPALKAHVNLPPYSGLLVQTIKPNGPAAKAGILPYDIIVAIDGVTVSDTNQRSAELQKAAGKPQKMTVFRQGKEMTLDIVAQLAEAPRQPLLPPGIASPQLSIDPMAPQYDPYEDDDDDNLNLNPSFPRLQQFMERQRRQMDQMRQRMEAMENAMRQGMPGFIPPFAPGFAPAPAPAPNGVLTPTPAPAPNGGVVLPPQMNDPNAQVQRDSFSVQVQKNGNEPAIIKIQENGNEYIVDENSIDQLPENVRNRLNFKIQTNDK